MKFKKLLIFTLIFLSLSLGAMSSGIYSVLCPNCKMERLDEDLIVAIEDNDVKKVKSILVDAPKNYIPDKPLLQASFCGSTKIVKLCLECNADANAREDSYTALRLASEYDHPKVVKLLLEYDAQVDTPDYDYWWKQRTALSFASQRGCATIVNILLKHKANIIISNENITPLDYASRSARFEIVKLFLKYINHLLDQTDNRATFWDKYILYALIEGEAKWSMTYPITIKAFRTHLKTINAFRMLLHHADKLPRSTKELQSITAKALRNRRTGEEAFRETVKHLRENAF